MGDSDFDAALVKAAFALGAEKGWRHVSGAAAARHAGLDLAAARIGVATTASILKKFGRMADAAALKNVHADGSVRDKLFDMLLRRLDFMQEHRAGVLALLKALPLCPPLAVALYELNLHSMGWLLEAAGVHATGLHGAAQKRGLLIIWGYALQAWARDDTEDLSATMAAVDTALARAEGFASRYSKTPGTEPAAPIVPPPPPPDPEPPFADATPPVP